MWKLENKSLELDKKRRAKMMEYELSRDPYLGLKKSKKENIKIINEEDNNQLINNYEIFENIDFVESNNSEYIEEKEDINVNIGIEKSFSSCSNDYQYRIAYIGDEYVSTNMDYETFNIRNEVKYLLDRVNNFCKPHDYNEIIFDNHDSKMTIGEYMILHREIMIRHSLIEKAGDDMLQLAKLVLPIKCNLHKKNSLDSLSYMSPHLMLTYDICSKKGCNVFVGKNENLNICNGKNCKTRRWKSCTNKKCKIDGIEDSCTHSRPALKQVKLIFGTDIKTNNDIYLKLSDDLQTIY
jgi:hypothetical protein